MATSGAGGSSERQQEGRPVRQKRVTVAALLVYVVVAAMLITISYRQFVAEEALPRPTPEDVSPVAGGVTHEVASLSQWHAAVAAAEPGDVIRLTATINARLSYRGDNDGGTAAGADGEVGAPIVITANPGVWVDPGSKYSGQGALDILYVNHVHAVGLSVRNAQFGIRCLQCHGADGNPIRIAGNTITEVGHAGIHFAGHWADHDPSSFALIEDNVISRTGLTAAQYGEGIYIGHGGTEWVDTTSDVVVEGNDISDTGAEGVDVKPGTRNVVVRGNYIHDLAPRDGGAISAHYVSVSPNPHPDQLDPVLVEGNYIWNVNLNGVGGSNDWAIWVGHGGVTIKGNTIWGLRNDYNRTRAVRVRATQSFGPHPIRIENNVFWTARGWVAEGTPSGASNVVASGNVGADAASAEIVVASSDFVGPVPGLGASGTADAGDGPGSALLLTSATTTTTAPTTTTTAPTTTTTKPPETTIPLPSVTATSAPPTSAPDDGDEKTTESTILLSCSVPPE